MSVNTPLGPKTCTFLLDTGAQCSIIDFNSVSDLKHLCCPTSKSLVSLGMKKLVKGYTLSSAIRLPCTEVLDIEFFCLPSFHLDIKVPGISDSISNLKESGIPLSCNLPVYKNDSIAINGILGIDVLSKFKVFDLSSLSTQGLLRLSNGFIPVGTINSLTAEVVDKLYSDIPEMEPSVSLRNKFSSLSEIALDSLNKGGKEVSHFHSGKRARKKLSKNKNIKKKYASSSKTSESVDNKYVNFVLDPKSTYFSPLSQVFPLSHVEHGLENLYSMESIGIRDNTSLYDDSEIESFEKGIEFRDGKYHVGIPWRQDILEKVPSNFNLAKVISKRVSRKNGDMDDAYFEVFSEQMKLDIIEEITSEDADSHIWIPHRPVIKDDPLLGVVKIRPVFNCSLKTGGAPSLNEAAYPGKDMLNSLFGLINYFRTNNFVLLGDIARAFLNIRLSSDCDKNRFSFVVYHNGKYRYFRYKTIIFGFIASPFILNYIISHHANKIRNSQISSILKNQFYVDNLVLTGNDKNGLIEVGKSIEETMYDAGFWLREWSSNDSDILSKFTESSQLEISKFLGLIFDPINDSLTIKEMNLNSLCTTKRGVVSTISSIFDPLGFIAPLLVEPKLFVRKLCESKLLWDEKFSEDLAGDWTGYADRFNSLINAKPLSINRRVADDSKPVTLFVFTDASTKAYGFVVYALQDNNTNLVFSKFKLSPQPHKTLPTLELLAMFLAMQCIMTYFSNVNCHLKVKNIHFLADSQIALSWLIKGKVAKRNVFVTNRLKDIKQYRESLDKSNIDYDFSYVPTEFNIADMLTKPVSVKKFVDNYDLWCNGPSWIKLNKSCWPKGQLGSMPSPYVSDDIAESESSPLVMQVHVDDLSIIDIDRYSSYPKLLACTIKVFEAIKLFKKQPYTHADLKRESFIYLVKQMQRVCFKSEIDFLSKASKFENVPKLILNLNLFLDDDGVLRSKGRVSRNVQLTYDAVNPVILGADNHFTNLLIRDSHIACCHLGVDSTMNCMRQIGFWVIKPRQTIAKVLRKCVICKRFNSRPFVKPPSPDLPSSRVNLVRPFAHTGCDYTGHFLVKDHSGNAYKVYILVFTCLNTRAIHLEMVASMAVTDFIKAFVRFHNRFGLPIVLYSDNARSFTSSSALLANLISSDLFQRKFEKYNLIHKLIPTYSPWFGATWERLIKTIKHCLFKTFGRSCLYDTDFSTALTDIQISINNRPLTYRDSDNALEILTPNHLISNSPSFPTLIISEDNVNIASDAEEIREDLLNTLELRDFTIAKFSSEFFKNYLLSLREKHRDSYGVEECNQSSYLRVGSVVLIKNPVRPRAYWHIGRIPYQKLLWAASIILWGT